SGRTARSIRSTRSRSRPSRTRSTRASRRSWTPPGASTSSRSATRARERRRRPSSGATPSREKAACGLPFLFLYHSRMNSVLTGKIAFDGTRTPLKTGLFLLVCAAWLLPGLVGHDPWKYDEAVVFGVVTEMLRTGDWLTFRIAGEA